MYKSILVPTDGSKLSDKAVRAAARLAKLMGAKLTLFHVAPPYPTPMYAEASLVAYLPPERFRKETEAAARKVLDRAAKSIASVGVGCARGFVSDASPADAILAAARKYRAEVIVMASHGRKGIARLLIGSETQKVLTHSKLPVLVVR